MGSIETKTPGVGNGVVIDGMGVGIDVIIDGMGVGNVVIIDGMGVGDSVDIVGIGVVIVGIAVAGNPAVGNAVEGSPTGDRVRNMVGASVDCRLLFGASVTIWLGSNGRAAFVSASRGVAE